MNPNYTRTILSVILLSFVIFLGEQNTFGQLLEIENKIPKTAPIKVEFKNQDSPKWARYLEIKVTNIGKKPIYFIFLSLNMKDDKIAGDPVGYPLRYGPDHLYSRGESLAQDEDVPILPKQSYTFKIEKNMADTRIRIKEREGYTGDIQRAILQLGLLNFGDGTGVLAGGTIFKKKL